MTQASVAPHPSPAWPGALRRGATFGVVASCHLALLALLLRPAEYREVRQPVPPGADDALQLIFIPSVTTTPLAKASTPPRPLYLPPRSPTSQRPEHTFRAPTRVAPMTVTRGPPPASDHSAAAEYQTGDFRARLQDAQRARVVPLPGAATQRLGGLRLRGTPSVQKLVRQLAVSTRCTAMRFDMQKSKTQFITAQLMDRMLEADGCGPHAERTPASEAADALTRQLMDER